MKEKIQSSATNNPIYGFGFIGALVYFLSTASNFIGGVIGILKAAVWPAILVYEVFKIVEM